MRYIKILLLLAGVMLLGQACKKNSIELNDYEGIAICASENFSYTTPFQANGSTTPAAVDFRVAPYAVNLTAELSEIVSWKIEIKGATSNAIKTFTGQSALVNVKWYGNPDTDVFFITGEQVTITFTPSCKESVSIQQTISHASVFNFYGTLVADFETFNSVSWYNSADPDIGPYVVNQTVLLPDDEASPQGKSCRKMYGPDGHTGWYIAGFENSSVLDLSTVLGNSLTPENVYVNVYIKGGTPGATSITIALSETVGTADYQFKKSIPISWSGWKLVTYKLSDFYIGNPLKVNKISFSAGPTAYNTETECYVDFIIFTKDKPFTGAN